MPEYTVRDPVSGRPVVLRGASPPTEQELETIFAQVNGSRQAPPAAAPTPPPAARPLTAQTLAAEGPEQQARTELGHGVLKGAANTILGLGEAAYRYVPGVAPLANLVSADPAGALTRGRAAVQPTTAAEQLGFTAEQIGEFFIPVTKAATVAKAAEVAKAGVLSLAQSGDPTSAAASAGLTAVLPGAGTVNKVRDYFGRSAQKTMAGALGATKEWAKAEAAELAPEMLARGVRGSRVQMLEQARTMSKRVGAQIGVEVQAAAAAGQTVPGGSIAQTIQAGRAALMTPNAAGTLIPIAGTEPVIRQLTKLEQFVAQLPADIPVDQAATIKTTWDRIVSKAGLYGPKAQASATDSAAAWSIREATNSFRDLIARGNPTIDDLNQHYKFWKGLRNVLTETERRTQAQGSGLISGVTAGAGIVTGLASGDSVQDKVQDALVYGFAGRQLVRLLQSPTWATRVSAPLKQGLADALASGSAARVTSAVQRIVASLPPQLRAATAP